MTNVKIDEKKIWDLLSEIPDPEIPVISITELGVVRGVEVRGEEVMVLITPTYTGCPAMNFFEMEIKVKLFDQGFDKVTVKTVYSPAWTTDWLSEEAKEKMRKYGIAPPEKSCGEDCIASFCGDSVIPCPRCGSKETTLKSEFGSTACKALYSCNSCLEPFEHFKSI